MHWLRDKLNMIITGIPSLISFCFSVITFIVAALVGANDDKFPLFYFLLGIGVLLLIIQMLVQIIEAKNQKISEDSYQLSTRFITDPKNSSGMSYVTDNVIAIKFNKLDADDMGFSKIEIVLNTTKKIDSNVDLLLMCHERLDIRNNNIDVEAHPFQKYFQYNLLNVFRPISSFSYTASFEIRFPKSSINHTSLRLKIGFDSDEVVQDFVI